MWQIIHGNNVDHLRQFADNTFDSVITDPPYGIDFLGKAWDATTGALETYQECLRVLKPGGHLLAFSAARTYHHLAVTVEQAGFEIRDQIMWIYSSGFPKSQDIGKSIERTEKKRADNALGIKRSRIESGPKTNCPKCNKTLNGTNQNTCAEPQCDLRDALAPANNEWAGWGTALKPAHEPIVMARKPIKLSIAKNCQAWGVGAVNIDACRIPVEGPDTRGGGADGWDRVEFGQAEPNKSDGSGYEPSELGRFPSNVIGDIPDYQKYFYCPKVGRAERHVGHAMPPPMFGDMKGAYDDNGERYAVGLDARTDSNVGNNHPTVKPIELMKYLIQLVTPPGGHVLDPFNGSGSTGCAAVELDYNYTGIELDAKYVDIARKRIEAWHAATHSTTFQELFE
jgi:DNA modification methylase